MRVVIAPDSFKECLSANEVACCLAEGWRRACPEDDLRLVPMADGGEGTMDALVSATAGTVHRVTVTGPLGEPVEAAYGRLGGGETAVIEMAAASGLPLVSLRHRNPTITTTYGTGELICHAMEAGARQILVGIGGSATNDGGAGMAQALGYQLLDADGEELPPGGAALAHLARIDASRRHPALDACDLAAACDVDNPLCGPQGATAVYGPQKGATPEMVAELDAALLHYGGVLERDLGAAVSETPGAGAAGGLGAGLMAFAGARLRPGVALVAEAAGLEAELENADLVITGEGRIDGQTIHGKTPAGVAGYAKAHGLPVAAVAGCLGAGFSKVYVAGIDMVRCISDGPSGVAEAIACAPERLRDTGEDLARFTHALRK